MEYLALGLILKTRGLKGEVKVKSSTDFASLRYKKKNKVYLYNEETQDLKEVHVFSYSSIQGFDYVSFEELRDINLVLPYIHYQIVVKKEEQPKLKKDTYYFSELVGCKVIDQNNNSIGEIIKIEEYSANQTLRIRLENGKDLLLPFVKAFIKKVDIERKEVNCHLIEGMI
jgi:16S rRNA processing protein RimM